MFLKDSEPSNLGMLLCGQGWPQISLNHFEPFSHVVSQIHQLCFMQNCSCQVLLCSVLWHQKVWPSNFELDGWSCYWWLQSHFYPFVIYIIYHYFKGCICHQHIQALPVDSNQLKKSAGSPQNPICFGFANQNHSTNQKSLLFSFFFGTNIPSFAFCPTPWSPRRLPTSPEAEVTELSVLPEATDMASLPVVKPWPFGWWWLTTLIRLVYICWSCSMKLQVKLRILVDAIEVDAIWPRFVHI